MRTAIVGTGGIARAQVGLHRPTGHSRLNRTRRRFYNGMAHVLSTQGVS
jgi:hypothetical protein